MPKNMTSLWKNYSLKKFADDPEGLRLFTAIPAGRARDFADQLLWLWETKQINKAQLDSVLAKLKG